MPREPGWWYRPPGLASAALGPIARVYGQIAEHRFDGDVAYQSSLPVICVGNFTAGGTGKTPVTAMIVAALQATGERPAILTRGYGGRRRSPHWVDVTADRAVDVGDEPLMLARAAPVLVARNRKAGAKAIEARGVANVIVMDDGLQNPSLVKDLVVAVVDGPRGLGNGFVIPAGPLRADMLRQGPRAGLVIVNGEPCVGLAEDLRAWCHAPVLAGRLVSGNDVGWLRGSRVLPYAGIGNPQRFFDMLAGLGAIVVEARAFADHAPYRAGDAASLLSRATHLNARLVTTEKDFVRFQGRADLSSLQAASTPIAVTMKLSDAGDDVLAQHFKRIMGNG